MGFEWVPKKNYKRHYVCLACQKGFKRSSKEEMKHAQSTDLSNLMERYYASGKRQDIVKYIQLAYQELKVVCPNCRSEMLQVHYDFEVPPQRDNKSWKAVRKDLAARTKLNYDLYVQWHLLELQKVKASSVEHKTLKANLAKLEKAG